MHAGNGCNKLKVVPACILIITLGAHARAQARLVIAMTLCKCTGVA